MKKMMPLLIAASIILFAAGCNNSDPAPSAPVVIPTEVVLPDTMKISELLGIVNTLLEFEEGWELDIEQGDVWPDPDYDETLYVFDYGDFEIVLFADIETDTFKYGYLRATLIEYNTMIEVASVAGAFLMALEPNEYENMLVDVLQIKEEDFEIHDDENNDFHEFPEEIYVSYGEVWGIELREARLFNIFPKDEGAGQHS